MYTEYFGLREEPFSNTSDPQFFYPNPANQKAYTTLLTGICERKGFLLLTGEAGTGKTTLLRRLMGDLEASGHDVFFENTGLTTANLDDLAHFVYAELGIADNEKGPAQKFQALSAYLAALVKVKEESTGVLLIDEAQNLPAHVLGSLRFLSPIDMTSEKFLLPIVLVGQPELEFKLAQPELRSIKQRIALQCRLECLKEPEVPLFIQHRLRVAGCAREDLFAPKAMAQIALYSQGVPRLINILCDNALLQAYKTVQQTVSASVIDDVAVSLRLGQLAEPKLSLSVTDYRTSSAQRARAAVLEQQTDGPLASLRTPGWENPTRSSVPASSERWPWTFLIVSLLFPSVLTIGFLYHRPVPILSLFALPSPEVTWISPVAEPGQAIVVAEGQKLEFTVTATSPQPEPLQYVWLLNGDEQGRGQTWTYQPSFEEGGSALKDVTVRVVDQANQTVAWHWQVRVQDVNRTPSLVMAAPSAETLEVPAGQAQRFSVEATDPDSKDQLTYVWSLNGQEVARGRSWDFVPALTAAASRHRITVVVADKEEAVIERAWTIAVLTAPPQLPQIMQATPTAQKVKMPEGQKLRFAVQAASPRPGPLQYVWLLDGHEQGRGRIWTYQPSFEDGGKLKVVSVRVSDHDNSTVERSWQIQVHQVNHPPMIIKASPPGKTVEVPADKEQPFSVEVTDPDKGEQLTYVWTLDGQEVAREPQWSFRMPLTSAGRNQHRVQVEVGDASGLKNHQIWNVIPTGALAPLPSPPQIVAAQPPDDNVIVSAGETLVFSLAAELPESSGADARQLQYQWSVNGAPPQITQGGRFNFRETVPSHYQLIATAISPNGLQSAPQKWTIEVRPTEGLSSPVSLSEEEVRVWLETHRQALEEKNVEALVGLGIVPSQEADRARKILSQYNSFRVAFRDITIRIDGSHAEVSFFRVDTIDGHQVSHHDRKAFILEKGANERLTARPQSPL